MLVLSRLTKEAIIISGTGQCRLVIIDVRPGGKGRPGKVRLGFEADKEVIILREELVDAGAGDGDGRPSP